MNDEFENNILNDTTEEEMNTTASENPEYEENAVSEEENVFEEVTSENTDNVFERKIPEFNVTHNITKKAKKAWPRVVALSLVAGIVFGAAFGVVSNIAGRITGAKFPLQSTKVELNKSDEAVPEGNISRIAQECMPSIVAITNRSVSDVMTFFGKYSQESTSSGSGIIIGQNDTELLIVTNYHVIANSKELSVVFSPVENEIEKQIGGGSSSLDNKNIPTATVKGYDSNKDLAVIAVKLSDITSDVLSQIKVATIGDSSSLRPGDQVVAIGNALGYGQSVTTGIISAVDRSITMESADGTNTVTNSFIQTDAAINSGNSGGALLDMAGHLIGINSVKIATTGVEGMGYAIPITDVEGIIDDLMVRQTRDVVAEDKQGFLGITGADVTNTNHETFGIPVGVFVNSVTKGLAAEKAGIRKGHVITKFDGYTVTTIAQLQDRLRYYKEGEKVTVTAMVPGENGYKEKNFNVSLSNRSKNIDKIEE